jgi:hypothetical protein
MMESIQNGSETKVYPRTNIAVEKALLALKSRNDNFNSDTPLTAKTEQRLNAIAPAFRQQVALLGQLKSAYYGLTAQKDLARTNMLLHTSHFLQVFNMGIKRGKYDASERVLFGMAAESDALPSLKGDNQIANAAEFIISGEAKRIADGKPAVTNPTAAEVEIASTEFKNLKHLTGNAHIALIDAQIALRTLAKEARAVVKKAWREIEVHYNNGDRPHMRKLAREWGVHYERKGGEKQLRGIITDAATGLPLRVVKVKFTNGNNKALSNTEGIFTLTTSLMHEQILLCTLTGYQPAEISVVLKEGKENFCEVKMVRQEEDNSSIS